MYRLAICDDENLTCSELKKLILRFALESGFSVEVDVFYSGELFCNHMLHNNHYEIVFLDIELETISGIAVGEYFRDELKDEFVLLIYISSKERYALRLFEIGTFEFLVKPINYEMVNKVLKRAFKKIMLGNDFFQYFVGKNFYRIKLKDIIYFQSILRKVQFTTTTDMIEFYGKLQEVQNTICNDMFVQIHNSYLINLSYVKEYTYDYVTMINDDRLSISKMYRKSVRNKIMESWRSRND